MPNDIQKIADMMDDDGDEFTNEPPDTIEGIIKTGYYGQTVGFRYSINPVQADWPVEAWEAQLEVGYNDWENVEYEDQTQWPTSEEALEAIEGHISEMMYTPEDDNYENRQMGLTALD